MLCTKGRAGGPCDAHACRGARPLHELAILSRQRSYTYAWAAVGKDGLHVHGYVRLVEAPRRQKPTNQNVGFEATRIWRHHEARVARASPIEVCGAGGASTSARMSVKEGAAVSSGSQKGAGNDRDTMRRGQPAPMPPAVTNSDMSTSLLSHDAPGGPGHGQEERGAVPDDVAAGLVGPTPQRWLVLAAFASITFLNAMLWITFAPIRSASEKVRRGGGVAKLATRLSHGLVVIMDG